MSEAWEDPPLNLLRVFEARVKMLPEVKVEVSSIPPAVHLFVAGVVVRTWPGTSDEMDARKLAAKLRGVIHAAACAKPPPVELKPPRTVSREYAEARVDTALRHLGATEVHFRDGMAHAFVCGTAEGRDGMRKLTSPGLAIQLCGEGEFVEAVHIGSGMASGAAGSALLHIGTTVCVESDNTLPVGAIEAAIIFVRAAYKQDREADEARKCYRQVMREHLGLPNSDRLRVYVDVAGAIKLSAVVSVEEAQKIKAVLVGGEES